MWELRSPSLGQAGASRICLHELLSSLSLGHKLDPAAKESGCCKHLKDLCIPFSHTEFWFPTCLAKSRSHMCAEALTGQSEGVSALHLL